MKVSIVIPTRSRADTLAKALRTAVEQSHDNVEIIVSNNGGDPATRQVVEKVSDRRVRCIEPDRRLSMSHNFEFAMSHATGDWLVLIGDDDGILPNGISRGLEILAESGAEALASPTCFYRWPVGYDEGQAAMLTIPYGSGWGWRSSKDALKRILSRDLSYTLVPTTYTGGMIAADLFRRIRDIKGSFYQSQIPDCYSAFALCSATIRYALSREPLMISGISGHSHGRASLSAEPTNFNEDENIPFHSDLALPEGGTFTSSFQAMLYESYLQTAYLRTGSPITSMEEQAVAILAYAKWYRHRSPGGVKAWEIASGWIGKAAAKYQLDLPEICRKAEQLPVRARLSQHRQFLIDFLNRYVVDEGSISDVYEASRVADEVLKVRPWRLGSYRRTIARRLQARSRRSALGL